MPIKRTIMRSVATLVAALATATFVSGTAQAQTQQGGHCRIVLDRLQPGEQFSKVLSRTCSDRPDDLRINAGTLLITWYEHDLFRGFSTYVEGAYGPCDAEGYGIRDTGGVTDPFYPNWWRDNISSFKLWNNCRVAKTYRGGNYSGIGFGLFIGADHNNLGSYNDQVRSLTLTA